MNERLAKIKLLAMDVDGTLTDGSMVFLDGHQIKTFNVLDGLGMRLAMNHGLKIAWITGNTSDSVTERAKTIGITDVYQGARFKTEALTDVAAKYGLIKEEIAYIGDDLNDIPAYALSGVAFAVKNAAYEIKDRADITTQKCGGAGAVREAIEIILKSQGEWDAAVNSFLKELEKEEKQKVGPEAVA